jgi:hypothetical protein
MTNDGDYEACMAELVSACREREVLRSENDRLLALENGDWMARYSGASREAEWLRAALTAIADRQHPDQLPHEYARHALNMIAGTDREPNP